MKTLIMRYPGDPPVKVEVMNRAEFFERFPPSERCMWIGTPEEPRKEVVPFGETICCDFCNNDPGNLLYLIGETRAYCSTCFKKLHERYCK